VQIVSGLDLRRDAKAARLQWRSVADQPGPKLSKLAAFMDEAEADVFAYMTFPVQHRAKLHSTHPVDRLNGEIKRLNRSGRYLPKRGRHCPPR
jgi:transposase-like protein